MKRTIPDVPGFHSVRRVSELLHLAPRSVRELIYMGRLPSVRLGRLHYVRAADVEIERRRRLGLALPKPRKPQLRRRVTHLRALPTEPSRRLSPTSASSARSERAAERKRLLERWLHSGHADQPRLPFEVRQASTNTACEVCAQRIKVGGCFVEHEVAPGVGSSRLCVTCARRAMLAWADQRRRDANAARQLAANLSLQPTEAAEQTAA